MKKSVLFEGDSYYQEAKSWYQENYESVVCAMNRYRVLAISLGILLGLSLIAFSVMLPLKSFMYRLIAVNQQTGEVTVLKELEGDHYAANWVVTRYFINQYIQQRQGYSLEDIKRRFNLVVAMSGSGIAKEYIDSTVDSNPKSPIVLLKNDYYRDVQVLSVNQLNDKTAVARFRETTHNRANVSDVKTTDWQVILKWEYVNPNESLAERDKNPLGFKVTYYQISPVFSDK